MTKAELLAAIADAPDDAVVYRDNGFGILQSVTALDVLTEGIVLTFAAPEPDEDDEP